MQKIDMKNFNFLNFTTFLRLDIMNPFCEIAQAFADIDPIPDGSIDIFYPAGMSMEFEREKDGSMLLAMLLQSGTKILDALAYLQSRGNEKFKILFTYNESSEVTMENQTKAIKLAMSSIVIFVTRGALPAMNGRSSQTRLPDFVKNIINDPDIQKEEDLKNAVMSYDPKHISMNKFFESTALNNWDPIVCNRLTLGVAGHKPLKVVTEVQRHLIKFAENTTDPGQLLVKLLLKKATDANNKFYPNLHPSKQVVASKFHEFYKQCLLAIYASISGNAQEKISIFKRTRAIGPDKWVQEDKFLTHPVLYNTWDLNTLSTEFGDPCEFSAVDRDSFLEKVDDDFRPTSFEPKSPETITPVQKVKQPAVVKGGQSKSKPPTPTSELSKKELPFVSE